MIKNWSKSKKILFYTGIGILSSSILASSICVGVVLSPNKYNLPTSFIDQSKTNQLDTYYDLYQDSLDEDLPSYSRKILAKKFAKEYFLEWFRTTSSSKWNVNKFGQPINAFCNSEQQAIMLYANYWGDFWNLELHQGKQPTDKLVRLKRDYFKGQKLEIRGEDYKYIQNALNRAVSPLNFVVYHGVEFMEVEFYDQLKDYISLNNDGSFNYKNTIGKTIETLGFISTTFEYQEAYSFSYGGDWINGGDKPPLKEPAIFKIYIEKGTKGVGYISDFVLNNNEVNTEKQTLLNIGSKFKILDVYKDSNGINIWTLKMIK